MPILGNFPGGGGSGGGLQLAPVTGVKMLAASGKAYIQWTDPDDLVLADTTLAAWAGTVLVRKAGSAPISRRDGVIVLDSKKKNAYQDTYFCDSGLTDGVAYYYKLFPYSSTGTYTDDECAFAIVPNPELMGNVSGITLAEAGNGKMSIKWTDPAAIVVEDGVTLATWASTIVVVKEGSYATSPTDPDAVYTYTSTTRNAYATNPLVATGLANGKEYYVSLFPVSTDGAANTNAANRMVGVANRIAISSVPSQSGTLTYTGSAQTPVWSNYNSAQLILGGTTSGTNATSYNATFTPKDDYMWFDDATTAKTVSWSIGKAAGSLTINKTTMSLDVSTLTGAITVTRAGDGAITATSSNTSIATVSVSGTTVTITAKAKGSATITINVAAGTNHTAPASKTCAVTVTGTIPSTSLADNTPATIQAAAKAGTASNYWSVGDKMGIAVNGSFGGLSYNSTVYAFILGFNHNSTVEGGNSIHFQFGKTSAGVDIAFVQSYDSTGTGFCMNTTNTNSGGWNGSYMRNTICPAFLAALPSAWQSVIVACTKYSDNTGGGGDTASYVTATSDKIWLLSEFEVFGVRSGANSAEQNYQKQYDYYKNGNSKVKYQHSATTTACYWWLRSVFVGFSTYFRDVRTSGASGLSIANYSSGFAPGFKVA